MENTTVDPIGVSIYIKGSTTLAAIDLPFIISPVIEAASLRRSYSRPKSMDSVRLTRTAFSLFFPLIILFLLQLSLPFCILIRLFLSLSPFSTEKLTRKVVLITGASSGIGEQLAYEYAKKGAALVLVARRENALKEVAENSRRLGSPDVVVAPADVTKRDDCKKIIEKAIDHFGQLNHLVVNAGMSLFCLFEEIEDIDHVTNIMDLNFWGSIYPTYYAIPHLRKTKGNIVVNASFCAHIPVLRSSIYNASKAAQLRFYETLRGELGSDVKITIVTVGLIESEITKGKLMVKDGIKVDQEALQLLTGPFPVESAEGCAKAIVKAACKGQRYLTWPFWYSAVYPVMFFVPEVLDWIGHAFFITKPGQPRGNALSKRMFDMIGAKKFYSPSIQSTSVKLE